MNEHELGVRNLILNTMATAHVSSAPTELREFSEPKVWTVVTRMRPTMLRPFFFARRTFQRGSATAGRHVSLFRPGLTALSTGAGAMLAYYYGMQFQNPIVLDSSSSRTPLGSSLMNWIHAKVTSAPLVVPNHTARRGVRSIWDDENPIASEPPILPPIEGGAPEDTESADQGAFNPETGEINWDCPCLGGMAHGPCGMEFRAAFSCFVYSEAEPKRMECVEKFKTR